LQKVRRAKEPELGEHSRGLGEQSDDGQTAPAKGWLANSTAKYRLTRDVVCMEFAPRWFLFFTFLVFFYIFFLLGGKKEELGSSAICRQKKKVFAGKLGAVVSSRLPARSS